ncbi:MAG TPA: acyl-CoA thioesterase domain-containing protein [Burkholderiales bacterium]|nr:acyl-CoA thioesterase domain-containing protein [Burkholderiales bacterium]
MSGELIRERVLRAIALNRTPGYHFAGNFIDLSFDRVTSGDTRISYETGPHCADSHGGTDIGSLALAADFALGTAIRADLDRSTRTATVSMALELIAQAPSGTVTAESRCHGFQGEGYGRIGHGRVVMRGAGEIGYASGAFMVLKPPPQVTMHPVPHRRRGDLEPAPLAERDLAPDELRILRHADEALERATKAHQPFIRHFWGYLPQGGQGSASCVMPNGPHVGNRVGHVQGGLLVGLAAVTAAAALPETWMLSAVSTAFISPGEGSALKAHANVVHRGQRLAVVRTEVMRSDGRRVLDVLSTHAALAG